VLFWQGVVVLALITPAALWFWVTPSLADALMLIFMGVVFTVGQWLWTCALRMGEASALAPLNYIKLLMAGVVGWLVYGETPTLETVAGGLLVMGAATYTIRRNAKQAAKVRPATLTPS
jgi:drug/metabolite transporter (DMT)-like permease